MKNQRTFTDGIVTATFDKDAGTLVFTGHGAIFNTPRYLRDLDWCDRIFVRTIIFENGITSIGSGEFAGEGYVNLEKVIFLGNINTIEVCAFAGNSNLTTVEFHGECRAISDLAFFECSALENINIPKRCMAAMDALDRTPLERTLIHLTF